MQLVNTAATQLKLLNNADSFTLSRLRYHADSAIYTIVKNIRLYSADRQDDNCAILIEDGRRIATGPSELIPQFTDTRIFDAGGS